MAVKFKDLTKEQIEYIRFIYNEDMSHKQKMETSIAKFGVTGRTIRNWWMWLNLSESFSYLPAQLIEASKRSISKDTEILLFTSAQNKTGINTKFLENLLAYKDFLINIMGKKTEVVIAPTRYRNPTSPTEERGSKTEQWWVDDLLPYLYYGKIQFGNTILSADSRIRPTAKEPLTGYEVLAKNNNLVLPHSKVHFKTLPRFKNNPLRTMSTTGYLTNKNYSDSKSGEVSYEHHSYGFVIVEKKKDGTCHIPRNVKVKDDGSFIDIIYSVENGDVSLIEGSEGFVWGDIHASEINMDIFESTLDLYEILKPAQTILHDVLDASTVNPHEVKDMYIQKKKIRENKYLIDQEIEHSFDILQSIIDTGSKVNITISNHEAFLDRYINDRSWKADLHNSHNYLKYALIQQTEDMEKYGSIYGFLLHEKFNGEVNYVVHGDSLRIMGYECGLHADNGSNGSRGSFRQFNKLNTKMIGGHSHCMTGAYQVQTLDKGWKEIRIIKKGDIILTYNPYTGKNEWNEVDEHIEKDYEGLMLSIKGNGFQQSFTKEHMLMMSNGDYIPAHEAIITRSPSEMPLTAKPVDNVDGISVPEHIVRKIVAIAADASYDKYRIRFRLKKQRKIDRLKEFFGDDLIIHNSKSGIFSAYISTRSEIYREIKKYKKGIEGSKRLSTEVLQWDSDSLEHMVDELKYWDGTFDTGNNGNQYSTSNMSEANIVMSALNRLGYSCSLNKRERKKDTHTTCNVVTWCEDRDFARSTTLMTDSKRLTGWGFSSRMENCKVYCVRVPNRCFWIRSQKTGDVSLTGNSPILNDGYSGVGVTCNLHQYYTRKGLSSWAYAHSVIHSNGKNQLLVFGDDGKISDLI